MHDQSCELCGTAREAAVRGHDHRVKLLADVRRTGCHKLGIFGESPDEPEFAYTVGLFHTYGHPELVVFGLPVDTAWGIIDTIHDLVAAGARFKHGDASSQVLVGTPVVFAEFARAGYDEHLGQAQGFYRSDDFPALMVAWPDRNGVFPWDPGAPEWLARRQPALWSSVPTVSAF